MLIFPQNPFEIEKILLCSVKKIKNKQIILVGEKARRFHPHPSDDDYLSASFLILQSTENLENIKKMPVSGQKMP